MYQEVEDFNHEELGSGKEQYDSFYDFRDQELDLALQTLLLKACNDELDDSEYLAA